jgi:sugar lactone lactonase YvrE
MTVNITDPQNGKIPCEVNAGNSGTYTITFLPQVSGEHKLVAVFLNKPIKGSETSIVVKSNNPVMKYGGQGSGSGKFLSPRAVAVETDGNFFVADTGNRLIQKISPSGDFITQFCVNNNKENSSTCDLALNRSKGQIVCTETIIGSGINPTMGNNVLVYSTDGTIQDRFTNKVMKCALCIATNSKGNIIVSDYLVHSLFMYDDKGAFIRRVGHAGTFNHPAFICVAEDDSIIVSDTNNDCVQIFDKEGNFVHQFGTSGNGKGQLKQPFGVATDGDLILVVDSGNKRIQVFDKDGAFVSMIESKDDPLNQPRGIAMATDGCVYVADRDNHCVKKYRYR